MNHLRRGTIIWTSGWLLASFLAAGMWVRSEHHEDRFRWQPDTNRSYFLGSFHGCVEVTRQSINNVAAPSYRARISTYGTVEIVSRPGSSAGMTFMAHPPQWKFAGFGRSHMGGTIRMGSSAVSVVRFDLLAIPYWCPLGLLVLLASFPVLVRAWRRMRMPAGHCIHCGYDLRASPERCPECGADSISTGAGYDASV